MTNLPPSDIGTDDLHAFVDGRLSPDEYQRVLAWLHAHPDDAANVAHWQAQRAALRRLHRDLELGPTPDALTRAVSDVANPTPGRTERRWPWATAAAVLLGVGVWMGTAMSPAWLAPSATDTAVDTTRPRFVHDATIAHVVYTPEVKHPVEVTSAEEAHLVTWLSRRLGQPIKAPTLQAMGYRLLGGRLLPGDDAAPRAQFMYENTAGHRLTLYVSTFDPQSESAPKETAFRSARDGKVESFYWVEGAYGYALAGELPAGEIQALARHVYSQLSR